VNSAADVCADPHIRARGSVTTVADRLMQAPAGRFSGFDGVVGAGAPALGEHTDGVLRDLAGLAEQEIDELRHKGVV
jgi:formyl-CoA transferase